MFHNCQVNAACINDEGSFACKRHSGNIDPLIVLICKNINEIMKIVILMHHAPVTLLRVAGNSGDGTVGNRNDIDKCDTGAESA